MTGPKPRRPSRPAPALPAHLTARAAALAAVRGVFESATPLDAGLAGRPEWAEMDARDRAFARALAAAVIRRSGALDAALAAVLERPLPDTALRARLALRCGAAELLILSTPPHAAVDAWVELMGASPESAGFRRLANAVLRRVSGRGAALFEQADALDDLPPWLAARWRSAYGEATARAMAAACASAPPLDLTLKPGGDPEQLARAIGGVVLPTGTVRRTAIGLVEEIEGYDAGAWWVQDAAAALPARLLAAVPGESVGDLCAAPGGKTLQLAATGAQVSAVELSARRLRRVEANLARTGLTARLIKADAAQWRPDAPLDAVLLDAPCTATGTLRRRPDAAWAKRESDIAELAAIQSRLLDAAFAMLRQGGRMIFCTCSMEPEEGEAHIPAFLARTPDAALDPVRAGELPGLDGALAPEGWVRTRPDMWAGEGGLDGFFIARIVRAR
ncbi:MAG: RsmB/NOP family class I SAM-dependent RNA methyltransferase [Oceanicaulis sp.]|nr:RsmB/NOP family class I SAM-dependent RNA methyltransferase [Oceanicaulis sp.]